MHISETSRHNLFKFAIAALLVCWTQAAYSLAQVEFFVGDRVDPTRKWGHVSLRVYEHADDGKTEDVDLIFDFGRYGRMWNKDIEGDPILRVWDKSVDAYIHYHMDEGGTTKRFTFESTHERNAMILAFYQDAISKGEKNDKSKNWTSYVLGTRAFHAVDFNCTTSSIQAFMKGFPEYNLNVPAYAEARTLGFFLRGYAKQAGGYDSDSDRWSKIWWPLDLRAVLEDLYVAKSLAHEQAYQY